MRDPSKAQPLESIGCEVATVAKPRGEVYLLGMHLSGPIDAECATGGLRISSPQRPGDMDFVPAGTAGS